MIQPNCERLLTVNSVILDNPELVPSVAVLLNKGWLVVADFHSHDTKMQSPGRDQTIAEEQKNPGMWIYPDKTVELYGPKRGILNIGVPNG